jgi:hypothetical protein
LEEKVGSGVACTCGSPLITVGLALVKWSLFPRLKLPAVGVAADEIRTEQDWHAGSRRQKK